MGINQNLMHKSLNQSYLVIYLVKQNQKEPYHYGLCYCASEEVEFHRSGDDQEKRAMEVDANEILIFDDEESRKKTGQPSTTSLATSAKKHGIFKKHKEDFEEDSNGPGLF